MSEALYIDARVRAILQPARDRKTGRILESLAEAAARQTGARDPAVRAAALALLREGDPWERMRAAIEAHDEARRGLKP